MSMNIEECFNRERNEMQMTEFMPEDGRVSAAVVRSAESEEKSLPEGGYGWSYGVFLAHYLSSNTFPGTTSLEYAFVGGLSISCAMLVSPIATYLDKRISPRFVLNLGAVLEALSLITTSLVSTNWQLFLSQGICFGIGMGFCFCGSVGVVSHWFERKRSLVNGIATAGSGIGGLIYSLAVGRLIPEVGFPWAMRILGIVCFMVNIICGNLLRIPSRSNLNKVVFDLSICLQPQYIIFLAWGLTSVMGYVALLFSLSSYTVAIGFTQQQGSIASALLNLGQALGRPAVGMLSDRLGRLKVAFTCTFLAGVLPLTIWIFAQSLGLIYFFAIFVGLVAGTMWAAAAPLAAEVVGLSRLSTALGILWFVLSPPTAVAEVIALQLRGGEKEAKPYFHVQLFVGILYLGSSICLVILKVLLRRNKCRDAIQQGLPIGRHHIVNEDS